MPGTVAPRAPTPRPGPPRPDPVSSLPTSPRTLLRPSVPPSAPPNLGVARGEWVVLCCVVVGWAGVEWSFGGVGLRSAIAVAMISTPFGRGEPAAVRLVGSLAEVFLARRLVRCVFIQCGFRSTYHRQSRGMMIEYLRFTP